MSSIAKAALAAALLNCGLLNASADDLSTTKENTGQWLKDGDCSLFGADASPGDTVSWTGSCPDGLADGLGTATFIHNGQNQSFTGSFSRGFLQDGHVISRWGQGWSYVGETVAGRFKGQGILTTDAGDRFEGQWRDGKMNGFGVLLRANGERYSGEWKDDKANGRGDLRRADGSQVSGLFTDGKLAPDGKDNATVALAEKPSTTDTAPSLADTVANPPSTPFGGVSGKTLTAVDGSSIALNLIEGGMELQLVPTDGRTRKTTFTFMTDRMGTVVDDGGNSNAGSSITGFFRLGDKGIEIRYADGRSAILSPSPDGGVLMALEGDSGSSCRGWYPAGHVFSDSEKKAALNAYASKLGLPVAANEMSADCAAAPKPQASNVAPPALAIAPTPALRAASKLRPETRAEAKKPGRVAKASYRIGDYKPASAPKALEAVEVKTSEIHGIDGGVIAVPSTTATAAIGARTVNPENASDCLKVASDGIRWGFRNGCDFAVQFAYCMAGGQDGLTACGTNNTVTVSAVGSVAAKGFGALTADTSFQEKDTTHNFRWIACAGGAGEVVAHLDQFEPPAGRCERSRTASAR